MPCIGCGKGGSVTPRGAVRAAQIQTADTTEVRSWTELPLLDINNVPDDLDLIGGSNKEYQSWRIPASYFIGGGLNTSKHDVPGINSDINVPSGHVLPVFITVNTGNLKVNKAKAKVGETATQIAVMSTGENVTLMDHGFYTFDRPHQYEVGATYYLSQTKDGEVVSTRPSAGIVQPLFSVPDHTTISINVNLY